MVSKVKTLTLTQGIVGSQNLGASEIIYLRSQYCYDSIDI